MFGHLAPLLRCKLPNRKLQQHLSSLENLSSFCGGVLQLYFPRDGPGDPAFSGAVTTPGL